MITRFAPSPTGPLHLGHAFSALTAWDLAKTQGGQFLLRIEDIDQTRSRPAWEAQIYDDLQWLGLHWPEPVMRQSERMTTYQTALARLDQMGLLYPCDCNRRDIQAAMSAPQEGAPMHGPDGLIYPGTCRHKPRSAKTDDRALRLDMRAACQLVGVTADLATTIGDVVLARRGMGTSYHLSVVVDDAAQGITDVVRGADLLEATPIHKLLQKLLKLPAPTYHHHRLIRDEHGKRLAKRDDARALSKYRAEGATPQDIRDLLDLVDV